MKDQYFGDQTDFIKYGILRAFIKTGLPLVINWMLTASDGSNDGRRTSYLHSPSSWRSRDPEVFDVLRAALGRGDRRVSIIEDSGLLAGAVFHSDLYMADLSVRTASNKRLHSVIKSGHVVFFDPDNGLEVKSVAMGRRNSEKYVFLNELEAVWRRGCSILLYQHFPRVSRDQFLGERKATLELALSGAHVVPVLTSHVAFLMIAQPAVRVEFARIREEIIKQWWPHAKAVGQSDLWESPQLPLYLGEETRD
jgi:hypothetical protein